MILRKFISLRAFTVYMETHCGLKFHFGQFDQSEICIKLSFTTTEVMWTLITKLPHTKVKFYVPSCRSFAFTSYKSFLTNKKKPGNSPPVSFSTCFLKKNISLGKFY